MNFGRERRLEISVRGGGHNVAGRAVADGGLMIDLSLMKGVRVDPARATVRAQAGVRRRARPRERRVRTGNPGGDGRHRNRGPHARRRDGGYGNYGMAVDNLLSVEVVLAAGEVVTASEETEQDLFWAIRGGGGNFGVVASFELPRTRSPAVLGGAVLHPLDAAPRLLSFYREFAAAHPGWLFHPGGLPPCPGWIGHEALRRRSLPRRRGRRPGRGRRPAGRASSARRPRDMVRRMPYPVVNTGVDWLFPFRRVQLLEVGVLLGAVGCGRRGADRRIRAGA